MQIATQNTDTGRYERSTQTSLFRCIEAMATKVMPAGHSFIPDPTDAAGTVCKESTWTVLAFSGKKASSTRSSMSSNGNASTTRL